MKRFAISNPQLFTVVGFCFLVQFVVDWCLQHNVTGRREFTALLDPVAHFTLAIMVTLPWVVALKIPFRFFLCAVISAVLIDLDHFIAAGSFSLSDAIQLPARPMAHSLIFVFGFAVLCGLVMRSRVAFYVVLLALICHLSRDASGGGTTPLFWPFDYVLKIPQYLHLGFWLVVGLAGAWRCRTN